MPDQLQLRGGTTAQHASFTGASKEITIDTTKKTVVVHDGSIAGGNPVMREDGSNSSLALGSASSPSLKWDANTGIYSPGPDQVAVATNGTGRLFVDAAGNVGIGVSTPSFDLTVDKDINFLTTAYVRSYNTGSAAGGRLIAASAVGNLSMTAFSAAHSVWPNTAVIGSDSGFTGGLVINAAGTNPLQLYTNSSERLRITSAGLVGIGTSVPGYLFEASRNSTGDVVAFTASTDRLRPLVFSSSDNTASGAIWTRKIDSAFGIHAWSTNSVERMRLDSSGNVGIGTTTPISKLEVDGDIRSAGRGTSFGFILPDWRVYNSSGGNALVIDNYTTEALRVDSSNRLLVGTSSSPSLTDGQYSKLHVIANTNTASGEGIINIGRGQAASSAFAPGTGLGNLFFTDSAGAVHAAVGAATDGTTGAGDYPGRLVFSTTADGASSPTERMRITNAGILKVSNNSTYSAANIHQFNQDAGSQWALGVLGRNAVDPYGIRVEYTNAAPNGTVSQFLYCIDTAGVKAEIRSNGGLANYQANNVNLSDINTKKNISPAAATWDCIKEWEIVNYRYKDQPDDADLNLGVIAQQVAESCPEVITVFQEAKEATEEAPAQEERLGVKEQQMYWMAIKALQEAQVRIEQLEQRLNDAGIN
jgi:hypothetical protein